jgi:ABC-type multidrug transport system permease subunit
VIRFRLLLLNELRLVRTALPIHVIAIVQPCVFFLLLSMVMVKPTFDMNVVRPQSEEGRALVLAMQQVATPDGVPYIDPIIVSAERSQQAAGSMRRQSVFVEERAGIPTAVQRFALIDSNQVKNLRNRLTAAALRLWQEALGDSAVTIVEHPWLPQDVPYIVYFGMAMLPLTVFLAADFIGGILAAQEFEAGTITEYRLSPTASLWVLAARLTRLTATALLAAGVLAVVQGWYTGYWPGSPWRVALILLPTAIVGSCVGLITGLLLRRSIPTLAVSLLITLGSWILGGAFGLASSFSGLYEVASRATPHSYTVDLLFGCYYGTAVGTPWVSAAALALFSLISVALAFLAYRWRVLGRA